MDDLSAASDSSATGCRRVEQRAALLPLACGAPCTISDLPAPRSRAASAGGGKHKRRQSEGGGNVKGEAPEPFTRGADQRRLKEEAYFTNHKPRANEEGTNDPARHDEQLTAKKPQNQYTKNRRTNP
jgi:hypothetical protein